MKVKNRVLLKLSGEVLAGGIGFGIDIETVKSVANEIKLGYQKDPEADAARLNKFVLYAE